MSSNVRCLRKIRRGATKDRCRICAQLWLIADTQRDTNSETNTDTTSNRNTDTNTNRITDTNMHSFG